METLSIKFQTTLISFKLPAAYLNWTNFLFVFFYILHLKSLWSLLWTVECVCVCVLLKTNFRLKTELKNKRINREKKDAWNWIRLTFFISASPSWNVIIYWTVSLNSFLGSLSSFLLTLLLGGRRRRCSSASPSSSLLSWSYFANINVQRLIYAVVVSLPDFAATAVDEEEVNEYNQWHSIKGHWRAETEEGEFVETGNFGGCWGIMDQFRITSRKPQ